MQKNTSDVYSSGSSGRVRGGGEKHEIYVAAFGGHLFYDFIFTGPGGGDVHPWIHCWYTTIIELDISSHMIPWLCRKLVDSGTGSKSQERPVHETLVEVKCSSCRLSASDLKLPLKLNVLEY